MKKPLAAKNLQLFWGIALIFAGLGVLYRIPQVMPEIDKISQFSGSTWIIRLSFYIMSIILLGGGLRKVWYHFKPKQSDQAQIKTTDTKD